MAADERGYFTEAECFAALSWGMDESEARRIARAIALEDPAVQALDAENKDLGLMTANLSEDFLALLSFVSEECSRKVEMRLVQQHNRPLTPDERVAWDNKRIDIYAALRKSGKLPPSPA